MIMNPLDRPVMANNTPCYVLSVAPTAGCVPQIIINVGRSGTSAEADLVDILAVSRILKWSSAFNGMVGAAALLLPLSAAPESHIQAQTPKDAIDTASSAAAHVNFKIIIPRVLSLRVPDADTVAVTTATVYTAAVATVAVTSNSHNVTLTATGRSPAEQVAGNIILSAAARKTIAQDAVCAGPARAAGGISIPAGRIVCTASMP
jgi:hypothetical protein